MKQDMALISCFQISITSSALTLNAGGLKVVREDADLGRPRAPAHFEFHFGAGFRSFVMEPETPTSARVDCACGYQFAIPGISDGAKLEIPMRLCNHLQTAACGWRFLG